MEIKVFNPRPTTTGVINGYDLDFVIRRPGQKTLSGEITLCPDHNEDWAPCGPSPDYWISNGVLQDLIQLDRFTCGIILTGLVAEGQLALEAHKRRIREYLEGL